MLWASLQADRNRKFHPTDTELGLMAASVAFRE